MLRGVLGTAVLVAVSAFAVAQARSSALSDFSPAAAAGSAAPSATASRASVAEASTFLAVRAGLPMDSPEVPAGVSEATLSAATTPPSVETATPTEQPIPIPARTTTPTAPAPTAPPVLSAPAPTAVACNPGSWFCYPRLGISGAIVPYTDCSGSTDVGTQIRSFNCLSPHYLMAHAYTQFGKITGWEAGDIVIAYGQQFTITGAFVQSSCMQPRLPLAPLEMQTSLTPSACGDVLVVQAR